MDSRTLELFRCLQSGPFDEPGLKQIQRLLGSQRRALAAKNELGTLQEIIQLLEGWAIAAGNGRLSAAALGEAAEIAERELRQLSLANELRARAVRAGRRSGDPTIEVPHPEATDDELSSAISRAEAALETDASPVNVRALADLYARRSGAGDREQAADLYCTLGEVLGNPAGVELLSLALAQVPDHAEARQLLQSYGARISQLAVPRVSTTSLQAVRANPSAAAPPPLGAAKAAGLNLDAPLSSPRISAPRLQAVPAPPALGASRPPAPPASSLSPVVLSDAPDEQLEPAPRRRWGWAVAGLGACAVAAGFLLARPMILHPQAETPHALGSAPAALPDAPQVASATPESTAQPTAAKTEPQPPATGAEQATATGVQPGPATGETQATGAQSGAATAAEAASATGTKDTAAAELPPSAANAAVAPAGKDEKAAAHRVEWLMDQLTVRGGTLNPQLLGAALEKNQALLDECYGASLQKKPKLKGKLVLGFTLRPNGHPTQFKHLGGNIKEPELIKCTVKALEAARMPRPRKAAAQIKLPFQYQPG